MPPAPPPKVWTIKELLAWTTDFLKSKGVEAAKREAELLLAHVLQTTRTDLIMRYDEVPADAERTKYRELITRRNLTTGRTRIRLAISAGSGTLRDLAPGADHVIWMTASKAATAPPSAISADLSPWVRNERSPLAGLKCASYAENALALAHAASLGFEETIFSNTTGRLCEAATANLFLVRSGGLLTPALASGCLPGITRGVVLELAQQLGLTSAETDLYPADLWTADEVFLTSSTGGLMEVSRLARRTMAPAPLTATLRKAWHAATRGISGPDDAFLC